MERVQLDNHGENPKDKQDTLQENLTRVNMDTVEDMPFSRFLVRISNSYYQTIGKFTRQLVIGIKDKDDFNTVQPSKKQFMQKYKKRSKNKLLSLKNSPKKAMQSKRASAKESLDMLTIPEELTGRGISTRRIGRQSKRSNYQQAVADDEDLEFQQRPVSIKESIPV